MGNLGSVRPPDFLGHTTTFTLDPRGNVLRRTDPDGLHQDWTYNAAGQPLTNTSRAGHTTTYAYDTRGRLTTIIYPGPSSTGPGLAARHHRLQQRRRRHLDDR